MKIVIEWNYEIGEARMSDETRAELNALLGNSAPQNVFDVDLADFLKDACFITEQAYQAVLNHEPKFKDYLFPATPEEAAEAESESAVLQ